MDNQSLFGFALLEKNLCPARGERAERRMYRRSLGLMAKQAGGGAGRTIVRDPRRARPAAASAALRRRAPPPPEQQQQPSVPPPPPPRLPFEPSRRNEQTVGGTLAAYALAGVGVSLGVGLVRFFLGW